MNLSQHSKNQFIPSTDPSNTVNFSNLSPDWPYPFLNIATPKIFNHLLIWTNLYQHAKNQLITFIHSWDTDNYRVQTPGWHVKPKTFQTTFNFREFKSTCKKRDCWICSGEIVDLEILQSGCLRAFWPISLKKYISKILDLCRKTANNINLYFRTNSVKIMTKF